MKQLRLLFIILIFSGCFFNKSVAPELSIDDKRPSWAIKILSQHHPALNNKADYDNISNIHNNILRVEWKENNKLFIYQEGPGKMLVDVILDYQNKHLFPVKNIPPIIIDKKYYILLSEFTG
ncbi:hypothetical protein HOE31_01580 [bacterium]|jgi:hypothetical protein|nr:hypothetical protein [bacterium]MBT4121620.1 hypothetical protein [bacterium]MBT4335115.1 hypothetical protein [bacterium]MBT4495278.1 hypothetical protein [bacterium]MBT4763902.1 hypothetical protein [bacterium]